VHQKYPTKPAGGDALMRNVTGSDASTRGMSTLGAKTFYSIGNNPLGPKRRVAVVKPKPAKIK
jgi:hypothetical protein